MSNILPLIKTVCKLSSKSSPRLICRRLASSSSGMASSPIYELRMYAIHPKDFKTAMEHFNKNYHLRLQHSKLFGFWTSEIGDHITQFVHIWEYDSLSHRRQVRTAMAGNESWNTQFLPILTPCIAQWKNSLMLQSPESTLNTDFNKDPSAVYLLDQVKVSSYKDLSDPVENKATELLVGRFCGVLGPSKKEYRLWRYSDIDEAAEASKRRAMDAPADSSTMLLYPTKFSPLQ